jgi:hypothetical protein
MADSELEVLPMCVRSTRSFLSPSPNRIVVVSGSVKNRALASNLGIVWLDESRLTDLFPKKDMPKIISRGLDRTGWYFQQFLKWAVRQNSETEDYVVVDADTVFVAPVRLRTHGKYLFYRSSQYHPPYFATFEKLLGYRPQREPSYITNYMIMNCGLLDELLQRIEERGGGRRWHAIVLDSIDRDEPSSFSEFETYGYFMSGFHADSFASTYSSLPDASLMVPRDHLRYHSVYEHIARSAGFKTISYHHVRCKPVMQWLRTEARQLSRQLAASISNPRV